MSLEHRFWFLTGRTRVADDKPGAPGEPRDWIAWTMAGPAVEYREAVYVDACEGIRRGLLPVVPETLIAYIRELRKRAS